MKRRVRVPLPSSKLKASAVLCVALGACTIDEAVPVTWKFNIDCKLDADRTEYVQLQVAKGDCPITGPVVFETVTSQWDSPNSRKQGLPEGRYAFQGTAFDANGETVATYCESVELPNAQTIGLPMQSTSGCGGGDPDAGNSGGDSGSQNNGIDDDAGSSGPSEDGGPTPDGGPGDPDAAACPDNSDRDSDGVLDCLDECPDDRNKSMAGQCGCSVSELDTDGDETPDCMDNCASDENKTEPGDCGCNPKTRLQGGEKLLIGDHLCGPVDDSVRLTMGDDGNLQLRVDGSLTWASNSTTAMDGKRGTQAKMQQDGNLVIRTDTDAPVWSTGTVYAVQGASVLSVNANGTITIVRDGTTVAWTAGVPR